MDYDAIDKTGEYRRSRSGEGMMMSLVLGHAKSEVFVKIPDGEI